MDKKTKTFFIVQKEILPEAIRKTALAKELLAKDEVLTVNEAVEQVGLSRSGFYKYKDGVFPFNEASKGKIITLTLLLEHQSGVLSTVLNTIADAQGNILTINQGLPLQGMADASISMETVNMVENLDILISRLQGIVGVKKVEMVGQS